MIANLVVNLANCWVYGCIWWIYTVSMVFYGVIYKSMIAGGPSCRVLNKFDDAH